MGIGPVSQSINSSTGRMVYMGKVMNRAARVAGFATSSQVRLSKSLTRDGGVDGVYALTLIWYKICL